MGNDNPPIKKRQQEEVVIALNVRMLKQHDGSFNEIMEYAQKFKLPYPERIPKPRLAYQHNSQEASAYSVLLADYEKKQKGYEAEKERCGIVNRLVEKVIMEYIRDISDLNMIIPEKRERVFDKAFEKHSEGYHAIYRELEELVQLLK